MMVTNPTITTLTVTWNPADGNVQGYKVIYVPEDGGMEIVVGNSAFFFSLSSGLQLLTLVFKEKPAFWMTKWKFVQRWRTGFPVRQAIVSLSV